jgi:hypothetical protein
MGINWAKRTASPASNSSAQNRRRIWARTIEDDGMPNCCVHRADELNG